MLHLTKTKIGHALCCFCGAAITGTTKLICGFCRNVFLLTNKLLNPSIVNTIVWPGSWQSIINGRMSSMSVDELKSWQYVRLARNCWSNDGRRTAGMAEIIVFYLPLIFFFLLYTIWHMQYTMQYVVVLELPGKVLRLKWNEYRLFI